jgi:two-component system, chemotaxis family, chemotaxis protein CheY
MMATGAAASPFVFAENVVTTRPVLLVDSDPDARVIMRRLLEYHGYRALEAVDRDAALALAREHDVSLIVSELFVTCGDGMTCLIESLKADRALSTIPVLIVTTQAFSADEERAQKAGSAGYIVKPFAATDVIAHVARLVPPAPS